MHIVHSPPGVLWECADQGAGSQAGEAEGGGAGLSNAAQVCCDNVLNILILKTILRTVADNLRGSKNTSEMFDSATVCFTEIDGYVAFMFFLIF